MPSKSEYSLSDSWRKWHVFPLCRLYYTNSTHIKDSFCKKFTLAISSGFSEKSCRWLGVIVSEQFQYACWLNGESEHSFLVYRWLLQGGVLVVGGNSKYEVPLQLHSIAMHQQSVLGVHRGTRNQLSELVQLVAAKQVWH